MHHRDLGPGALQEAGRLLTVKPRGLKRIPLGLPWVLSTSVCGCDGIIHNECNSGQMADSHIFETSCN